MDPQLRRRGMFLLLLLTVSIMTARVCNVELQHEPSVYKFNPNRKWPVERPEPRPTFGSNDRARWATVRALVEEGTFVIGRRVADPTVEKKYRDEGILFQDGFKSIDVVLHPERQEFFGTKPPLFTLLVAGEYWLIKNYLKWDIREQQWEVVVTVLLTLNVLPLAIALWLMLLLIDSYARSEWGRWFAAGCTCFGTMLPTFAITLNNHVPATCCVVVVLYMLAKPTKSLVWSGRRLLLAGFFAGCAACLDLPAAGLGGIVILILLLRQSRGLLWFLPTFLLPIVGQILVGYQAYGIWVPVYAKFGGPWYEYAGSHWNKKYDNTPLKGIDFADEPKQVYAFHLLFGHHGLFSLTPIWLLSLLGAFTYPKRETSDQHPADSLATTPVPAPAPLPSTRLLWYAVPVLLLIVILFYVFRTNNWGGWTSGPRWLFWLSPLLLWLLIPMADRCSRSRFGRGVALLLLGVSIFSAAYPSINPWRHPWIFQLGEYLGWWKY